MSKQIQEIERDIEAERLALGEAVHHLSRALSPERISAQLSAQSGAIGRGAMDVARANPAAAIFVGAGVAAALLGPKRPPKAQPYDTRQAPSAPGALTGDVLHGGFDARVKAADARAQDDQDGSRAAALRAAINDGLADLPEPARKRIVAAREAVIAVQEKLDRKARAAARRTKSLHQRQPLSTGALALGLGAVVAALLPRTRAEDDLMGAHRDALLQEAEFALRDELARAAQNGEAALRHGLQRSRPTGHRAAS